MPFILTTPAALAAVLMAWISWTAGAPLERGRDHHVVVEMATAAGPALLQQSHALEEERARGLDDGRTVGHPLDQ